MTRNQQVPVIAYSIAAPVAFSFSAAAHFLSSWMLKVVKEKPEKNIYVYNTHNIYVYIFGEDTSTNSDQLHQIHQHFTVLVKDVA